MREFSRHRTVWRADDVGDRPNVTALLAEADAARPEIKRAAAAERAADAGISSRPARRSSRRSRRRPRSTSAAPQFADRASAWIVGGELRWTFSTGGAELAGMQGGRRRDRARTRAEADDARAAVHVEVVSALRRLESARAREAVGRAAVEQARESQRIIRDRFDAGIASVNDVLRASTAVLDAEANRVAATRRRDGRHGDAAPRGGSHSLACEADVKRLQSSDWSLAAFVSAGCGSTPHKPPAERARRYACRDRSGRPSPTSRRRSRPAASSVREPPR